MSEKSDYFWSNQKFPYRKFIPSCEEESDQKQPDPFVLRPLEIKPLETLIRPEKRKVLRTVQKGDKLWSLCTHMTSWQSGFPLGQGLWAWMMYFSVPHVSAMVTTRCCTSAHQFLHTHTHTHTHSDNNDVCVPGRQIFSLEHTHTHSCWCADLQFVVASCLFGVRGQIWRPSLADHQHLHTHSFSSTGESEGVSSWNSFRDQISNLHSVHLSHWTHCSFSPSCDGA